MRLIAVAFFTLILNLSNLYAGAAPGGRLVVPGNLKGKAIPIAIEGYTGEAAAVLKFDLEVMGCVKVPGAEAAFVLSGSNTGAVKGALRDAAGNFAFNRNFQGGSLRQQAHALSNDVIMALTGVRGIADTRILYKMKTGRRSDEVYVADYDGHKPVAITGDNTLVASPRWAPGNDLAYYTSWMKIGGVENTTVVKHDLSNGKRTIFSRYRGLNTGGSMSQQGSVGLVLSRGNQTDLYIAPPGWGFETDFKHGRHPVRITNDKIEESGLNWSPDGSWLCFCRGLQGLYKVPAQGGNPVRIRTAGAFRPSEPDWSPDGQKIAFTSQGGRFFTIFVVSAAGGQVEKICDGEDPSWAANSRNIIFTRRGVNKRQLAIVDVVTKRVKLLPALTGSASQPDWQH